MVSFIAFNEYMESFRHRNERLKLRRLSLRADLLKERCTGVGIDFGHIMQADFILFMRAELEAKDDWSRWWPETLLYLGHFHSPFEIFSRATSTKYFDQIKCLLNINKPEDIDSLLRSYEEGKRKLPRWEYESFNPKLLLGYDQLAKNP